MAISPNSSNAQTFAENDALPLLETLESQLSDLSSNSSDVRFRELDSLLDRFIRQANQARVTVLSAIATRLRAVLQQFDQHQQTVPIDSLIQQLLMQAHECLQLPVTELSMFGEFDAQQAIAKAEPILQQLEARLTQVNPAFTAAAADSLSGLEHSSNQSDDWLDHHLGFDDLNDFASSETDAASAIGSVGDLIDDLFSTDEDVNDADADDWLMADDVLSNARRSPISDLELAALEGPGLDIDKLFHSGFATDEEDSADWLNEADAALDEPAQIVDSLVIDTFGGFAPDLQVEATIDSSVPEPLNTPDSALNQDLVTPANLFDDFSEAGLDDPLEDVQDREQALADTPVISETDLSLESFEGNLPTERNVVTPSNLFDWTEDSDAPVKSTANPMSDEVDDDVLLGQLFADKQSVNQLVKPSIGQSTNQPESKLESAIAPPPALDSTDINTTDINTTNTNTEDSIFSDFIVPEQPTERASLPSEENEVLLAALFANDAAVLEEQAVTAEPTSTILSPRSVNRSDARFRSASPLTSSEPEMADAAGLVASFWHSPESVADQGLIHLNRDRVEALNQQIVQLTVHQSWLHHQHQSLHHTIAELQLRTDSTTDAVVSTPVQARLTNATTQLQQMEQTLAQQQETISRLRDQWIDAQTLPIHQFLQRFPTWLSQSVLTQHKPVQISMQAISARLDRATLETLQDAIAQLLQYSIEYSIEPQDIRRRRGKPEVAQLTLKVQVQGRQVSFELADDGWGLDLDAIRQDAAELGWGDEQTLANLSLTELIQQGAGKLRSLTTATRQVSTLSLVQTRLQDQQGQLSATTTPGQGLTFTIQLPLPLIKLDGLLCQVNDQFLAFSAAAIEEIVVPAANQLDAASQRLVWNGKPIPVIALTDHLADICDGNLAQQLDLPPVSLPETWHSPLLIVQTATHPVAIAVDAFVAQEALVIQALSPASASGLPDHIQGCAALRNGQQVVMLDAVLLAEQLSQTAIAV